MKENELRKHAVCNVCHEKIGKNSIMPPMFAVVKVQKHVCYIPAMQRQSGLEMFFGGNVAIAQAMGENEDMTKARGSEIVLTFCDDCLHTSVYMQTVVDNKIEEMNEEDEEEEDL